MLTLYSMPNSGNSYKVRLLLSMLGRKFRHVTATYENRLTASPEFLAKNPKGRVPVLELEDGRILTESNAILLYLSEGTRLLPADPFERAIACSWMFFEQNNLEPSIAVRAGILNYPHLAHRRTAEILEPLLQAGHRCLAVIETQLQKTSWLTGRTCTVADITLFGYVHSAGTRGGYDMDNYPAINGWIDRIRAEPGFVPLDWLP